MVELICCNFLSCGGCFMHALLSLAYLCYS